MKNDLVYGFLIPGTIWGKMNEKIDKKKQIIELVNKSNEFIKFCSDNNFIFSIYIEPEEILIGLRLKDLTLKASNELPLNEFNSIINENESIVRHFFTSIFESIITDWADIIKTTADKIINGSKDLNEKIEIPQDIEIPGDLKVLWYVFYKK